MTAHTETLTIGDDGTVSSSVSIVGSALVSCVDVTYGSNNSGSTNILITDQNGTKVLDYTGNTSTVFTLQRPGYASSNGGATSAYVDGVMTEGPLTIYVSGGTATKEIALIVSYRKLLEP